MYKIIKYNAGNTLSKVGESKYSWRRQIGSYRINTRAILQGCLPTFPRHLGILDLAPASGDPESGIGSRKGYELCEFELSAVNSGDCGWV